MDLMYQSLGGDGYISPGRRSYHPSTDLRDNQHKHRIAQYSLATLTTLILLSSAVAAFLFFPRPATTSPSGSGSAAAFFTLDTAGHITFTFNHTITITNNNYYPLPVPSALVTFTLQPLPTTAAPNHSHPLPPPALCTAPLVLGSYSGAASSSVSPLQTSEWVASGVVVGEAGVAECLREWCWRRGAYELWMDALVRVSYMQVSAALVADTVTVCVECPHNWWSDDTKEITER